MSHPRAMWLRRLSGVAAATAAFALAACSDTTSTGPTPTLSGNIIELPPRITEVCKVGPEGTYNFEAWSVEGIGSFLTGTAIAVTPPGKRVAFTLAAGQCKNVYQTGGTLEGVGFAEVAPLPPGVTLDKITWQTLPFLEFPAGPLNTVTGTNSIWIEPFAKPHRVTFYNAGDTPGFQGCTPGFWKNSPGSWPPTGYATGADFDATFGVNAFNPNISLITAAGLNGGGLNALARHAVAALLNAAHPDVNYPLTEAQIIAGVQAAIASGNYEGFKNTLDTYNNYGCTLDNDNSF